jgi:glutathione synthase/RimK-type ligase-like ATP-grasp enzyme
MPLLSFTRVFDKQRSSKAPDLMNTAMTTPPRLDVVILTEARYERPDPNDWYQAQILREERLLQDALHRLGLRTERVAWSNPTMVWSTARCAVFRTTWDYFDRFREFSAWVARAEHETKLLNAGSLIRWNWDKHYLLDLAQRSIAIPPTRMIEAGSTTSLEQEFAAGGWREAIIKPAISGAARHTYRLDATTIATHAEVFTRLIADEAMLLQEFQSSILTAGEISLIVIGGRFSHAVRKRAKAGDFRVQDDHGGTVAAHDASADEIRAAEQAVAACPQLPLYARVDLVRDGSGRLLVMELELIEPELFLRFHPPSADDLARAIAAACAPASAGTGAAR